MKFKFIGKPDLVIDNLTTDVVYTILQFQQHGHHLLVYLIDNNNDLKVIPYISMNKFNDNWSFMSND